MKLVSGDVSYTDDGRTILSAITLLFHSAHNGADKDCLKPTQTGSLKNFSKV